MKCEHKHECEQCIREKIATAEKELQVLKAKLPNSTVAYQASYTVANTL